MTPGGLRRYLVAIGTHLEALGPEVETISIDAARRHLVAISGTIDVVLGELELEAGQARPANGTAVGTPAGPCPHPEDERQDAGSLRHPHRFYCRRCGHLITESTDREPTHPEDNPT